MQMKNVKLAKQIATESHFPDAMEALQLLEWKEKVKEKHTMPPPCLLLTTSFKPG